MIKDMHNWYLYFMILSYIYYDKTIKHIYLYRTPLYMAKNPLVKCLERMTSQVKKLIPLATVFDNPKRKEIYSLVKEKHLTITEISKQINLSYQNTFAHVKHMEKLGLLLTIKHHETQGRKVYVHASHKSIDQLQKELILKSI